MGCESCPKVPVSNITKHLRGLCATLQEVIGIQLSSSSVASGKHLRAVPASLKHTTSGVCLLQKLPRENRRGGVSDGLDHMRAGVTRLYAKPKLGSSNYRFSGHPVGKAPEAPGGELALVSKKRPPLRGAANAGGRGLMTGNSHFFPPGQAIQVKVGQADRLGGTCLLSIQTWILHQLTLPRINLALGGLPHPHWGLQRTH